MELIERLNVPLCQKTRVPVKTLVEQTDAEPSQKKLLESHIASMYLVSLLNQQTIRLRPYKDERYSFMAIYIFQVELKINDQLSDLTELIHSAFPESTLLLMKYQEKEYLSGAMKRINKNDSTKTVIEDSVWTVVDKEDDINLSTITTYDLKEYYEQIIKKIYSLKVKDITGIYPKGDHDYKAIIKSYEGLNADLNKLKEEYSKATMMAEKMCIDDDIYDNEQKLDNIIKQLRGE